MGIGFLKKFGQVALKVTEAVAGLAPIAQAIYPKAAGEIQVVSQDLKQVADIIMQVEAVGQALQLPGQQKLVASAPLVAQVILRSSLLANHKIENPTLFQQGAQKIADGMADILNSLEDKVESVNKV